MAIGNSYFPDGRSKRGGLGPGNGVPSYPLGAIQDASSRATVKRMVNGVEGLQKNGGTAVETGAGLAHPFPAVDRWLGPQKPSIAPPPLLPANPASMMALGAPSRLEGTAGNVLTRCGRFAYENGRASRRTLRRDTKTGEETQYIWDCCGQLREILLPSGWKVRIFYDAFGRRVRKDYVPPDKTPEELRVAVERHVLGKDGLTEPDGYSVSYLWDDDELCAEIWSDGRQRVHAQERGTFVPLLQSEGGQV